MNEIDRILARESVELLDAMQRNEPGAQERLAKWMKQSRRHIGHYLMTAAFERELDRVPFDPELPVASHTPVENVVTLQTSQPRAVKAKSAQPHTRRRASMWKAAAMVAGIAVASALYWQSQQGKYVTAVGEQRVIELADGSVIHLNTSSRMKVNFSDHARDIRLAAGEALFKVHQDPARPFRVHTADAVIQAIGTEFNVYSRPEGTRVAVLEGRIKVTGSSEADLTRGQEARIDRQGQIATRETADAARVAAWRQRRLIFAGTPLPEMVAEFNRYNRIPQLVLEGAHASERVFSGVFDADDPESLIQLLQREPGIEFVKESNRIVVKVDEQPQ